MLFKLTLRLGINTTSPQVKANDNSMAPLRALRPVGGERLINQWPEGSIA